MEWLHDLVDAGFNASRSNAKKGAKRSACDVVAKAVNNYKQILKERSPEGYQSFGNSAQSFGQISKIWYARD